MGQNSQKMKIQTNTMVMKNMACIFHGIDEDEVSDNSFSKMLFITSLYLLAGCFYGSKPFQIK